MTRLNLYKKYDGPTAKGLIYSGDAITFLQSLDDDFCEVVFLDPPFNLGKRYGSAAQMDTKPDEEYASWLKDILDESVRILKPGGSLFLYHLPQWAIQFGRHLDATLDFRHWIAVSMKNGFARGKRLYPAHYALLYYTKGQPLYFQRPKTEPQKCRHCGGLVKDYGGYRSIIESKGLNISDIWDDLSPVRHVSKKTRQPNELPLKFMQRVIRMSGEKRCIYVDPFAGSGTGIIAAIERGLEFFACDIVRHNCKIMDSRVEKHLIAGGGCDVS